MADFWGHIYIGVAFHLISLWWLYSMCRSYVKIFRCANGARSIFIQSLEEGRPYRSELSYPTMIRGRRVHLEILLKTVMPVFAFITTLATATHPWIQHGGFTGSIDPFQHMTIYSLFLINGVVDFIDYMRLSSMREFKYLTGSLAYAWYGCAFYFHSSPETGKDPLTLVTHRLLVVPSWITAAMYILEMFRQDLVSLQIIRVYFVMMIGTWFDYLSYILCKPFPFPGKVHNWDRHDMGNVHFMTIAFGIHLIVNALIVMTSFYVMESYRKWKCAKCIPGVRRGGKLHAYEEVKLLAAEEFRDDDDDIKLVN